MLEHPRLLLRPWTEVPAQLMDDPSRPQSKASAIVSPMDEAALGYIVGSRPTWKFWQPALLKVVETPDLSLLFTAVGKGGLWRTWQVADAEEQPVGELLRRVLYDPLGEVLAFEKGDPVRHLWTPDRQLLATWESTSAGLQVEFLEAPENHPFVRMLILARVGAFWADSN